MDIIHFNDNAIIVDYAHTPDAVEKIIKAVREFATNNIYTIIGCGGNRDKTKRPIMAKIATDLSDYVIFTSDNPRSEDPNDIINDMVDTLDNTNYEIEVNREKAIKKGIQKLTNNDILLLLGKGHETYQIIEDKKLDFDDKKIVLDNL
jgi:UDP-N-acetylmuramoyl-L-alanyl-D-glutamate--2,6-diaminopimelate ligase